METQLFPADAGRSIKWQRFLARPLGKLYLTIPFRHYAKLLPKKNSKVGRPPLFSPVGGLGLLILKHRCGCSDKRLIEYLNDSKPMQYFCGIDLAESKQICDDGIVSRWRSYWGQLLGGTDFLTKMQLANAECWKEDIGEALTNLADATCYESHVRFPTDEKLLWECINYLYPQLKIMCKYVGIPMFRSKYKEVQTAYQAYQKRKRKSRKQGRKIHRRLLFWLERFLQITPHLIGQVKQKEQLSLAACPLKSNFFKRLSIIKKVFEQQRIRQLYPERSIKNRIVSLAKPYLRPIVRGKEIKRVEFGMKVHEMQINGINFIEHWNFSAFHEGNRMKKTLWLHQYLFRKKCRMFGGDKIYGTNKNRRYCSQQGIQNCFVPKGKPPKDKTIARQKKQVRQIIGKERATRLEGSFGNKKNHYLLGRIKARNYHTELAWVFCGNLVANAHAIVKRRKSKATSSG